MTDGSTQALEQAEATLFAHYGIAPRSRFVRLADPALQVRVLESGEGDPVVLIHGSGMCAATWAPVMARLDGRHVLAVDLPGFGASDAYVYERPLREEFARQSRSLLDALELDRVPLVGTSLGGMWSLCAALELPERVSSIVSFGVPAVALPGMRGNAYFRIMTTPLVGRLVSHLPPPKSIRMARRQMADALGERVTAEAPDAFYAVVTAAMRRPGWGRAMWTHLNLALRSGRQRMENAFSPDELHAIGTPVCLAWGDADVYGGPSIAERAAEHLPRATVEVWPGGHAPFLDDPEHAAELIRGAS
jgi:pimeloyl-ACP methyl ester carboxylesterase